MVTEEQKKILDKLERGETSVELAVAGLPFEIYKLTEREQIVWLKQHPEFIEG